MHSIFAQYVFCKILTIQSTISISSIKWFAFITQTQSVLCEVRIGFSNIFSLIFNFKEANLHLTV